MCVGGGRGANASLLKLVCWPPFEKRSKNLKDRVALLKVYPFTFM